MIILHFLDSYLKSPDGSVEGVQHEHGQSSQLGSPVPAVCAVDNHRGLVLLYQLSNTNSTSQHTLQWTIIYGQETRSEVKQDVRNIQGCIQDFFLGGGGGGEGRSHRRLTYVYAPLPCVYTSK